MAAVRAGASLALGGGSGGPLALGEGGDDGGAYTRGEARPSRFLKDLFFDNLQFTANNIGCHLWFISNNVYSITVV